MNEYQKLIAKLKVTREDMRTLHHHLVGPNWFGTHEVLGEYYAKFDDIADHIVEIGLSQGITDVPIDEAVQAFPLLPIEDRNEAESYSLAQQIFLDVDSLMQDVIDAIEDGWVISMLNNYQEWLHLEADYKMARATK